jgi:hypothetical protein
MHLDDNAVSLAAVLATIIVAFIGYRQFILSQKHQSEADLTRNLFDSLKWFEGGTQKRSIGIAIIEGSWEKRKEELGNIWKPLLLSQAIHILNQSSQDASSTELTNLERILGLISRNNLTDKGKTVIYNAFERNREEWEKHALGQSQKDAKIGIKLSGKERQHLLNKLINQRTA